MGWVCGFAVRIKGVAVRLARGGCAGRVDKSVVGGILEWVKIWARVCVFARGSRGLWIANYGLYFFGTH